MSSKNKTLTLLSIFAALLIAAAFLLVLFYAPIELTMGIVQKVFYFHMSSAWVGMLAFILAAVFGVVYLSRKDLRWDTFAAASVEIGLLFTLITILSGMVWARPTWNTWWTWDPRLTTVTIMAFTYLAWILLRRGVDDPVRRAHFGAVYALVGVVSVPLTFFSARLLRTIHPIVFGGGNIDMNLNRPMIQTLIFSVFAFTVLFLALLFHRVHLLNQERHLQEKMEKIASDHTWEV